MPLPTAYGTIPLGGALPEAYIPVDSVPLLGGALESGYGEVSYAVKMTAAASGSNGITVADDNDIDFGTGDFFIHWEGSLPDWTPSASVRLWDKLQDANNYIRLFLLSTGILSVESVMASSTIMGAAVRATVATGLADGAIAKITACVVRETASAAGSVTYYLNGTQLGTIPAITAASTVSVSNSASAYICGTSSIRYASNTISCIVGNFAPTASEVLGLCTNGIPASWKWGSQTAIYTSDFSATTDGFSATAVTLTPNVDGIGGEDNWMSAQRASSPGVVNIRKNTVVADGKKQKISIKLRTGAGNSFTHLKVRGSGGSGTESSVISVPAGTTVSVIRYCTAGTFFDIVVANADGSSAGSVPTSDIFYTKEIVINQVGATMALLPDTIPTSSATTWSDTSGNTGGGTLPAAGATKVTIRR